MFSHRYPVWGCRCCRKADQSGRNHKLWNVYAVDSHYELEKKTYYKNKAKHDAVKEIVDQGEEKILEEELVTTVVTLTTEETTGIEEAIKKYKDYKPKNYEPTKKYYD